MISVLMVVVILISLLSAVSQHIHFQLLSLQAEKSHIQIFEIQKAAVLWLKEILWQDQKSTTFTGLSSILWLPLEKVEIAGGYLSGHLIDEQAKFNLNNILIHGFHKDEFKQYQRLIHLLGLSDALWKGILWHRIHVGGILVHFSQLSEWPDIKMSDIERLKHWVTILPSVTRININTASHIVLSSIFSEVSAEVWEMFLSYRKKTPFRSVLSAMSLLPGVSHLHIEQYADVKTHYFSVSGVLKDARMQCNLSMVFARSYLGPPVVIWQSMAF